MILSGFLFLGPGFATPYECIERSCYLDLGFDSFIDIFVVNEVFCGFHDEFGFFILISIFASSFQSGVIV